jgi:monoamine oxidase
MAQEVEVVVIGGGAAGIAAARQLQDSGVDYLLLEARPRLGGRAWTIECGWPPSRLDLGCGAELDRVSVHDLARYDDSGKDWRVVEGYGSVIAAHGSHLKTVLSCTVRCIDHRSRNVGVETSAGAITTEAVIVTLPSTLLAQNERLFKPGLLQKTEAAAGLPLGLADKLFLSLDRAEEFEKDTRLFGRTDRVGTGTYHFRPFGRPHIECYFGGTLAADLEAGGEPAFLEFATSELVNLFGSNFARRLNPLASHQWGIDPFSRGSYSYALPGKAECRAALASPVDKRLFFAGEACPQEAISPLRTARISRASPPPPR